jgi:hypothetical protein
VHFLVCTNLLRSDLGKFSSFVRAILTDEVKVNSTAAEQHAARLVFAGGAFTPPLTKGMLRPFGNPSAMTDSSPPQTAIYYP